MTTDQSCSDYERFSSSLNSHHVTIMRISYN